MNTSSRNRTISLNDDQIQLYLSKCVSIDTPQSSIQPLLNKTIYGNTLEVCKYLPKNSVDLIVADPPYNLTKMYGGTRFNKKRAEDYISYTREWLLPLQSILKHNGSIYICCDWESSLIIGSVLQELFVVRNRITWQREKGRGAKANWKNGMEDIWFATNSDEYTFNLDAVRIRRKVIAPYRADGKPKDWVESESGNYRDTCPSNFWDDITIPFWSMPENTAHPTQKPEKLIAKIILASSSEGDVVLDPFLGSGTTSVTAKKLNRQYVGIEQEPLYCALSEYRLELAATDNHIQGYENGVFLERNTNATATTYNKKNSYKKSLL